MLFLGTDLNLLEKFFIQNKKKKNGNEKKFSDKNLSDFIPLGNLAQRLRISPSR